MASLIVFASLGSSWMFDVGGSYGSFPSTRWYVVFGLESGSLLGVCVIAFIADRVAGKGLRRTTARLGKRVRMFGVATGVVAFALALLLAIGLTILALLQMLGIGNPNAPLPIQVTAILTGVLVATCALVGLQLPFVDRSVSD